MVIDQSSISPVIKTRGERPVNTTIGRRTSNMKCEYGHVHEETWWEFDARGIPLCKVCDNCQDERLAEYRPDVLEDPSYWSDEPIEAEDY